MRTSAPGSHRQRLRRSFPLVGLLLYYGTLALAATALIAYVPGMREALVAPITEVGASAAGILTKRAAANRTVGLGSCRSSSMYDATRSRFPGPSAAVQ